VNEVKWDYCVVSVYNVQSVVVGKHSTVLLNRPARAMTPTARPAASAMSVCGIRDDNDGGNKKD
jgi:hypothetical protein